MTPEECVRWTTLCGKTAVAVGVPRVVDGRLDFNGGSGVLVDIAGRHFVLTAGHVIHGRSRSEVAVQFPREDGLLLDIKPGEMVREVFSSHEPDVGAIELDPADRVYWRNQSAVPLTRFASWHATRASERVAAIGFPSDRWSESPSPLPTQVDFRAKTVRVQRDLGSKVVPVITFIARNVDNEHAPTDGRCFHVEWGHVVAPYDDKPIRINPHGVSGGPVLIVDREDAPLVGLVRSAYAEKFLLCEPIATALHVLEHHRDSAVSDAIHATIERIRPKTTAAK